MPTPPGRHQSDSDQPDTGPMPAVSAAGRGMPAVSGIIEIPEPQPLTMRDLADALADASMVQPLYLRDTDGRLWPVLDVSIAPRQGLVILESNPIPGP